MYQNLETTFVEGKLMTMLIVLLIIDMLIFILWIWCLLNYINVNLLFIRLSFHNNNLIHPKEILSYICNIGKTFNGLNLCQLGKNYAYEKNNGDIYISGIRFCCLAVGEQRLGTDEPYQ